MAVTAKPGLSELGQAALAYAARGWHVLPCRPKTKLPYILNGSRGATNNADTIVAWWTRWPDANIGLACGPASGVYVVDIDVGEDGAGNRKNGWDHIEAIKAEGQELPVTVRQDTPGGGTHFLYKAATPPSNKNAFRSGIDIRGDGYYIVVAPSIHPHGGIYQWVDGFAPGEIELAEFPDFMRPELDRAVAPWNRPQAPQPANPMPVPPNATTNDVVFRARAYLDTIEPAVQGNHGHDTLLWAARAMVVGFDLDDDTAIDLLERDYNPRCSPPWNLANPAERRDFRRKVAEARKTPGDKPFGWLLTERAVSDQKMQEYGRISAESLLASERRKTEAAAVTSKPAGNGPEWPEPVDILNRSPLHPVPSFDLGLLPAALRPWIKDMAERLQCPPDFLAAPVMVALSSLLGRRLAIRPKLQDDWTKVPNLWGMIVGDPSTMKSPALMEVLKPVGRLDADAAKEYEQQVREFNAGEHVAAARAKKLKSEIGEATRLGDEIEAKRLARQIEEHSAKPPVRSRFRLNDTTIEKLGEILVDNPNGLLWVRDELPGLFNTLERDGHESDRQFLLESWAGNSSFTFDRIGRGTVHIPAVCLSILGGIQPGPLARLVAAATEERKGSDGLLQRFQLAVWPDSSPLWKNVDRWPDGEAKAQAWQVFERFHTLDTTGLECTDDGLPFVRFSPDGYTAFIEWLEGLERLLRSGELPAFLMAHLAKYRSLVPSLALLIHLADNPPGPVGRGAVESAIQWSLYLSEHAKRIYGGAVGVGLAGAQRIAKEIMARKLANGFTARDIKRKAWSGLTHDDDIARALAELEEAGWLKAAERRSSGRPTVEYHINPRIGDAPGNSLP